MKKLYVFPGQGSQFIGMGETLFENHSGLIDIADEILGYSLKELCLIDPYKRLNQTQYTQPALYTVSVMEYLDKIEQGGKPADFLAGHSLGEYNALFAAGAFDFETGLRIVKKRGEIMSKAPQGAMAAVLDMNADEVKLLLESSPFNHIDLANINTSSQLVLSGDYDEIYAAEKLFTDAGARYIVLRVSAGFHSQLMANVAEEFGDFLKTLEFNSLTTPVISNLTAKLYPCDDYTHFMKAQINHSVKWYESISWALQNQVEDITEVGPGSVLTKMTDAIRLNPMDTNDAEPTIRKENINQSEKIVFMFSGQGSQYKNMGKELYETNPVFSKYMNEADKLIQRLSGFSIIEELYHPRSHEEFDDVRLTHPAIISVQYSLAQMLIENGISPTAVLGHSLGEYVAAVIAKNLLFEDIIEIAVLQTELLARKTVDGKMMAIVESSDIYKTKPTLFNDLEFAGENFNRSFIVSGSSESIHSCANALKENMITHQILPVNIGFHSPLIDSIKEDFMKSINHYETKASNIECFSCSSVEKSMPSYELNQLWRAISEPIHFIRGVKSVNDQEAIYVDLSPSGSLSTFMKYEFGTKLKFVSLFNQFSSNASTVRDAINQLKQNGASVN